MLSTNVVKRTFERDNHTNIMGGNICMQVPETQSIQEYAAQNDLLDKERLFPENNTPVLEERDSYDYGFEKAVDDYVNS